MNWIRKEYNPVTKKFDIVENTHLMRSDIYAKKIKEEMYQRMIEQAANPPMVVNYSLDDCIATSMPCKAAYPAPKACKPTNKENNMGYETTAASIEGTQREHLQSRLRFVKSEKQESLKDTFHMKPVSFKTADEVLAAMKAGNVKVQEGYYNTDTGMLHYGVSSIRFDFFDPAKDKAGYDAATKLLDKSYTEAKDKIIVLPLEKGLEALNTFEAATFH